MIMKHFLTLLCVLTSPSTSDFQYECPYEECYCYLNTIMCANMGLNSTPEITSNSSAENASLYLDANSITHISAMSLPVGLVEISLIYNPITTIDDNAFDQLSTTLQSLYFSYANLSRIPDAFLHLDSLKDLNIASTNISDWNADAMTHIGQTVETLNLEEVGLATWPVWIQYFQHLNELSLASNAISSIPDNAFDTLSNSLQILTLGNNKLTILPKSLVHLKNLTLLDLQNNRIPNITWLPQSNKLSSLSLHINHISDAEQLSNVLRSYADSLGYVTLSSNQLRAIPDLSFLTQLGSYNLFDNQISDPTSGTASNNIDYADLSYNLLPSIPVMYRGLKSVSIMSLQYNLIRGVQAGDIPPWIVNLDVDHNLITELSDTAFPENSSLQYLNLDNNPLVTISTLAFKHLVALTSLSLQNTTLTRLPLSLVYLTNIYYISLNNNTDLVCTCLEKSVGKAALYIDIDGMCGDISIYKFLTDLSMSCP